MAENNINDALAIAHNLNVIDDEELALLEFENRPKPYLEIPYWQYKKFDLDEMTNDECKGEFRFEKRDIFNLQEIFHFPEEIVTYNRIRVDTTEAICILLKRFAYPCRYMDMIPRFARPVPEICVIFNTLMRMFYEQWGFLLNSFERETLSPVNLQRYADAVHEKGAPLRNCWGFIDGTVRPISRPGINQRVLYNGHKRIHAIKFQSVATPDGLVAFLHGPFEGRRHDSGMLRESGLLQLLEQHSVSPNGDIMCIYGDPAYPLRPHLQAPFRNADLRERQHLWNQRMSAVRVSVEWLFGDIINYFKFLDFTVVLRQNFFSLNHQIL
ncbi:uncharacterized protein LOC135693124 [Rhopilema esculentum]|uniref:uncharacterized protein LOC135693124 n=1 Tax=Rhopilema esculentum TaxID=499914 RepID=UPI0031CFCA2C